MSGEQLTQASIENILKKSKVEARKIRKRTEHRIFVFVALTTVLSLIGYFYPVLSALFAIGFIIGVIGAFYLMFS